MWTTYMSREFTSGFLLYSYRGYQYLWHKLVSSDPSLIIFILYTYLMKGSPGAVVKLLPFDHEVMGSSLGNNLLQKCRERLLLDYSIRTPFTSSISLGFYGWTGRGRPSSMVPEPRSWVQFPPAMYFLLLCLIILTYLAVCWVRTWSKCTIAICTQKGECWTIA
jgi:hypothetical protein